MMEPLHFSWFPVLLWFFCLTTFWTNSVSGHLCLIQSNGTCSQGRIFHRGVRDGILHRCDAVLTRPLRGIGLAAAYDFPVSGGKIEIVLAVSGRLALVALIIRGSLLHRRDAVFAAGLADIALALEDDLTIPGIEPEVKLVVFAGEYFKRWIIHRLTSIISPPAPWIWVSDH